MKKISIAIFLFFVGLSIANSQVPEKFNYQGILRNSSGELIENTNINIQISLLVGSSTGSEAYTEQHDVTTNDYGQFAVQVGDGTIISGDFSTIDWSSGQVYLKTEVDESGGTSFTDLGVVQLVTVPYAIYAKDVENKDDADADPLNEIQDIDLSGTNLSITGGSIVDLSVLQDGVDDSDADSTNEIQDLNLTSNILTITNHPSSTEINLAAYQGTNTDEQTLSLTGTDLSITGGNTVDLSPLQDGVTDADADSLNEIQDIDLSGTNLSITGGSTIDLSVLQDGVTDADADPANEMQNLLLAGDTLKISNGNEVILPYDSSNWVINGEKIYYNGGNVGIGSSAPVSKLEVKSNTMGSDALFQVINASNDTVFAVYPDGVKIFVDSDAKGRVGGFAISGRSPSKAGEVEEYFRVTTDSTRIYVNETTTGKGRVGGFAISGRSPSKGIVKNYFVINEDSTRIYVKDTVLTKGRVGGFAISGRSPSKSTDRPFLNMNRYNYFIGHESGKNNTSGLYNSFLGYQTGYHNLWGECNVFIGYQAGFSNETGRFNNFIGYQSGYSNKKGNYNDYLGYKTGMTDTSGQQNILIGFEAGKSAVNNFQTTIVGAMASSAAILNSASVLIGTETAQFTRRIEGTVMIGTDAGRLCDTTYNDVFIGRDAGMWINKSYGNIFLGYRAATKMTYGTGNIFIGASAGYDSNEGDYNTVIGFLAGYKCNGDNNVFIGANAGYNETGSDRLYIDNTSTSTPLIGGDFSTDKVNISNVLNLTGVSDYPTSPSVGDIIRLEGHSTDSDGLYVYNGSAWASIIIW